MRGGRPIGRRAREVGSGLWRARCRACWVGGGGAGPAGHHEAGRGLAARSGIAGTCGLESNRSLRILLRPPCPGCRDRQPPFVIDNCAGQELEIGFFPPVELPDGGFGYSKPCSALRVGAHCPVLCVGWLHIWLCVGWQHIWLSVGWVHIWLLGLSWRRTHTSQNAGLSHKSQRASLTHKSQRGSLTHKSLADTTSPWGARGTPPA